MPASSLAGASASECGGGTWRLALNGTVGIQIGVRGRILPQPIPMPNARYPGSMHHPWTPPSGQGENVRIVSGTWSDAVIRPASNRLLKNPVSLPEDTTSSSLLPDNHMHVVGSAIVSAFLSSLLMRQRAVAGLYGSSQTGSISTPRARCTLVHTGSPDPVLPTVAP